MNFNPKMGEPGWRPYCLVCTTMLRMEPTDYGFQCVSCRNKIAHSLEHYQEEKKS